MKLRKAKICLNCDEVFEGAVCPKCTAESWRWLAAWLQPAYDPPKQDPAPWIGSFT